MRTLLGVCALLAAAEAGAQQTFAVPPDLWDRPRSARLVMDQAAVRQALDQYLTQPAARLVIHHGRGQEPLIQAEELRMWLMALAVDGARISLASDAKPQEPLKIEVSR
jgi:hypothetical protein